jgi:hypothetical protein
MRRTRACEIDTPLEVFLGVAKRLKFQEDFFTLRGAG